MTSQQNLWLQPYYIRSQLAPSVQLLPSSFSLQQSRWQSRDRCGGCLPGQHCRKCAVCIGRHGAPCAAVFLGAG